MHVSGCHGIPEVVMSDNGPQYSSGQFIKFADQYGLLGVESANSLAPSRKLMSYSPVIVPRPLKRSGYMATYLSASLLLPGLF